MGKTTTSIFNTTLGVFFGLLLLIGFCVCSCCGLWLFAGTGLQIWSSSNTRDSSSSPRQTSLEIKITQTTENYNGSVILHSPFTNDLLDNGCTDYSDGIEWNFIWAPVLGASQYQLYVIGADATVPVINQIVISPNYIHHSSGYIIKRHSIGWRWQVRAMVKGTWGQWSEERTFNVEDENTDCN